MSHHSNDLPSGNFLRLLNRETGVYMLIPAPPGYQLVGASDTPPPIFEPAVTSPSNAASLHNVGGPQNAAGASLQTVANPHVAASLQRPVNSPNAAATLHPSGGLPTLSAGLQTSAGSPTASASLKPVTNPTVASTSPSTDVPAKPSTFIGNIFSTTTDISCFAPASGEISSHHTDAPLNESRLKGMEIFHASCSTVPVYRMVFQPDGVIVKFQNREDIKLPAGVTHLADFLKSATAALHLVLVFATRKRDVINVDSRLWTSFTANTTMLAISGTLHPEELRRLVPALKTIQTLNIGNQTYLDNGSLVDFSRFIGPNIINFFFDARLTSNSTLIENIMALYGDLFMRQRDYQPCFKTLILVVNDFCRKVAFSEQLKRLSDMLLDDDSYATILTMTPGDDTVLDTLLSLEFKRGPSAFLDNADRLFQKFDYWSTTIYGKCISFGFLDPTVSALPANDILPL